MRPVFALATLLAATTAGAAPATFGQEFAPIAVDTFYAPDASVVMNPDADAAPTLSGVEFLPVTGTKSVLPRTFLSTSG